MSFTPRLAVLRNELRILGPLLFAVPLVVALGFTALLATLNVRGTNREFLAQMLVATLEACLPLAAGLTLAAVAAHDAALEVQLSLPRPYRFTVLRRCLLLLGWTLVIEAGAALALQAALPWAALRPGAASVLVWLAPTLWFAAAGPLLALLLRSLATAGALLGSIWIAQLVFHGYFALYRWTRPWFLFATLFAPNASFWLANRIELLLTAGVVLLGVWGYLHNAEWRFRGEES